MDENNQYGQAMRKPLPHGCIKKMKTPSLLELNRILRSISHEDKIGHLFVADIKFHDKILKQCYLTKYTHPLSKK